MKSATTVYKIRKPLSPITPRIAWRASTLDSTKWLITKGADPKAACKDPRVAAARAAGDEAEAEAIYRTVPKDAES